MFRRTTRPSPFWPAAALLALLAAPHTLLAQDTTATVRGELLRLINQHRQANGKGPLSMDSRLNKAAQEHTDWMKATGTFSHTGKNGSSFFERIEAAGGPSQGASAENIALNSTAQAVFNAWRNSSGHNRNMLGSYSRIGIGSNGRYFTAVFTD